MYLAVSGGEGYSLESLSSEFLPENEFKKISMKELFGVPKLLKDGSPSKIKELPPIDDLQTNPNTRDKWIEYSARDAFATYGIYKALQGKLRKIDWVVDDKRLGSMFEFYKLYWRDFGELLTDMERNGIKVDTQGTFLSLLLI